MSGAERPLPNRAKGIVSILALLFLVIFAAMSMAYFESTGMSLAQADNTCCALQARLAAEGGLVFCVREITHCGVSGCLRGQPMLDAMAAQIRTDFNGTGNLGGRTVGYDNTTITIPVITLGGGGSFGATITMAAYDTMQLHVIGYWNQGAGPGAVALQKAITMNLQAVGSPAFGFGICSQGPISIGNNLSMTGLQACEGSIYSGSTGAAISVGSGTISGAVSVSDPNAVISLGRTNAGSINYNVPAIAMPPIDRAPYATLATNIVDSTTNISNGVFKNIRIKANTNPVFGNVTIMGVMYVEAPNNIQFPNNVNFTA